MNITYTKQGDYLIPDLTIGETKKDVVLGKYSHLRLGYLKQHKRGLYTELKMKNELTKHLEEIQKASSERVEIIMRKLAEKENITEELKEKNQLEWVGIMNNIKAVAEEIVANELIYI